MILKHSIKTFSWIQLYAQEGTLLLRRYLYLIFQYCCDSDGEDEVVNLEPIYESSKSYHHRQLPDIIGTTDFLVREEFDIYKWIGYLAKIVYVSNFLAF